MAAIQNVVSQYGGIIKAVVLILLILGIFSVLRSVSLISAAKKNFYKIVAELHERDEKRVAEAELERRISGTVSSGDNDGFAVKLFNAVDDKLVYSGLSIKYSWLNASVYIIGTLLISVIALMVGVLANGLVVGLILLIVTMFLPYIIISNKAYKNYLATERQLVFFINLISSNAVASGDLLTILKRVEPRTVNPIKDALYRANATAQLTGKGEDGIYQLIREVEYPLFKEFIRNLDICGKQDADYRAVAKDFAKQAEAQLRAIERQRAIFINARSEVLLMMGLGVLLSFMTASFSETSLFQIIKDMQHSLLGLACLVAQVIIYSSSLIYVLVGKRK